MTDSNIPLREDPNSIMSADFNVFVENFIIDVVTSLEKNTFVKLSLGNYRGIEPDLKNIYGKLSRIKNQLKLSITYRYKTKDIVKNYGLTEVRDLMTHTIGTHGFHHASLFTLEYDHVLEYNTSWKSRKSKPRFDALPSLEHDQKKIRKIEAHGKKYLHELRITDENGQVYKNTQDKFKQINHFIEILSPLLKELPSRDVVRIVDMGSGKGYLTFALYDYMVNVLHVPTKITGVEYRKDLVELCNSIAKNSSFNDLKFVEGAIEEFPLSKMEVLIALHACDIATDDAIYKGITNQAELIVVAPCCHKQIRREIEKHKIKNELDFLTKHGIFLERQAEMITDGLRALILEYHGYHTQIMEFISDVHTPKNILLVALKKESPSADREKILLKIKSIKDYFGIGYHHLEKKFKLD